ncbi:hypothetical protein [Pseudothermotoga sp.]|uniref:hypothetical protein n=1 Tax=Pseudothermotoga sp. TaxID=2033661 RepID=UPI0031F608E3
MILLVLGCVLFVLLIVAFHTFKLESKELTWRTLWVILLCLMLMGLSILFSFLGG